jgi:hypothetical protein
VGIGLPLSLELLLLLAKQSRLLPQQFGLSVCLGLCGSGIRGAIHHRAIVLHRLRRNGRPKRTVAIRGVTECLARHLCVRDTRGQRYCYQEKTSNHV